jgi:hypothetical protein
MLGTAIPFGTWVPAPGSAGSELNINRASIQPVSTEADTE